MKRTGFVEFLSLLLLFVPVLAMGQGVFPLPDVPKELKGPDARANYLALHYWDRYDFGDNTLIGNKDISEQGFSNFISIMPYVTEKDAAFGQLAASLVRNPKMLDYFVALGVKYLNEPASPVYNEPLYILMLEKILQQPSLAVGQRHEFGFDLEMARKNRVGEVAADFSFLTRAGKRSSLLKTKGEYILLFFGDPECDFCTTAKEELLASPLFNSLVSDGRLKVLYVCVEGRTEAWEKACAPQGWIDACDDKGVIYENLLYELPGLPVLYLLDSKHRVLLKNVFAGDIERYLKGR